MAIQQIHIHGYAEDGQTVTVTVPAPVLRAQLGLEQCAYRDGLWEPACKKTSVWAVLIGTAYSPRCEDHRATRGVQPAQPEKED